MKKPDFTMQEQPEVIKLARLATGPQLGDTPFWQEVIAHLDAIGEEHPVVKPRPKKD